jgi:hypothetical protein
MEIKPKAPLTPPDHTPVLLNDAALDRLLADLAVDDEGEEWKKGRTS